MRLLLPKPVYLLLLLMLTAVVQLVAETLVVDPPNFQVISPPRATDPAQGVCSGDTIEFAITAPEAGTVYSWNFGDDSPIRFGTTIKHAYNQPGVDLDAKPFTVSVRATANNVDSDPFERTVYVRQTPEISFADEDTDQNFQICVPDSVTATDTTFTIVNTTAPEYLAVVDGYLVDWGNGGAVERKSPADFPLESPTYSEFGSYTIRITSTSSDPNRCPATFEQVFNYTQNPKAHFTLDKQPEGTPQSCTPVIVSVGDSSSGAGLTYEWEVLDQGNIGGWEIVYGGLDQDTLGVRFEIPGQFQIQLIVSNGCGRDTTEQSFIVGWPSVQLPAEIQACGDTTIVYNQSSGVQIDPNFGNTVSYEWFVNGNLVSTEEAPSINFPNPGTYTVSARVTNECGNSDQPQAPQPQRVTIFAIPGRPVIANPNVSSCEGGVITVRPTGGGPGYVVFDSPNNTTTPVAPPGLVLTIPAPANSTTYYVRSINQIGCLSDEYAELNITVTPPIQNVIEPDNSGNVCSGQGSFFILGNSDSGYTYLWQVSTSSDSTGFSAAPGTNIEQDYQVTNLSRRSWFRRVVTSGDCELPSNVVEINVQESPRTPAVQGGRDVQVCLDSVAVVQVLPEPGLIYRWYDVATGGTPRGEGTSFEVRGEGSSVIYVEAVNSAGCPSQRIPVNVTVTNAEANAGDDITVIQGRIAELRGSGAGTNGTYLWEPAEGLNNPAIRNPIARPQETTTYVLTITTELGCVDTDTVTVTVIPAIKAPNAFSPNRDGVNEVWEIENISNYPDARVEVFNRWGNLIFSSTGYGIPWDGTYKGSELPVATYYYIIYLNSSERPISGNVTIIR
ncbi:T9SS type B sorting domain-containing protein [Pontibacter qinzhouensis]|uniref:T9SS type B sorting domain-containing protein n=1 Tax=Pontibacter qinzhouensis TaxID=2603253 RepID=A0A5C8KEU4_9BACT|nr:gliding motility-associated C-terminal domain-containing protein [Pontibacter qinzhouensis]TXK51989.1 T9SS type B sorting domain-containing protein [Pontibacter qinzhouensis]